MFLFDRDPGCSLFIPVRSNRERAQAILDQAAAWLGRQSDTRRPLAADLEPDVQHAGHDCQPGTE